MKRMIGKEGLWVFAPAAEQSLVVINAFMGQ